MQLFKSRQQIPWAKKYFNSVQSQMPCPWVPHMIQYITDWVAIIGGWVGDTCLAPSPSCNSRCLKCSAKSSILDCMVASGLIVIFSSSLELETVSSFFMFFFLVLYLFLPTDSSSNDDTDSFSNSEDEDSSSLSSDSSTSDSTSFFFFPPFTNLEQRSMFQGWYISWFRNFMAIQWP